MTQSFTLTQLEYLVAVDTWRHFALAAERCFVTQPTLSMQLQKMERDLGVLLFDRSRQPVVPTEAGKALIKQARVVLNEAARFAEQLTELKGTIEGELRLGIIPTIAPFLMPLFINPFLAKYPKIRLTIHEVITENVVSRLKDGRLDVGLLSTPLDEPGIREDPLFYEEFAVYLPAKDPLLNKKILTPGDIDLNRLWLLEEGHCFRAQIVNLCDLQKATIGQRSFDFQTGSLETLRTMVDMDRGMTIIPQLAIREMSAAAQKRVRWFRSPAPVREISLVTHRNFVKMKMIGALREEILKAVPATMHTKGRHVIPPVVEEKR